MGARERVEMRCDEDGMEGLFINDIEMVISGRFQFGFLLINDERCFLFGIQMTGEKVRCWTN